MGNSNTTESNDVQMRLMSMLDSVRLDSDDAPPKPTPPPQPNQSQAAPEAVAASGPVIEDPNGTLCKNCNVKSNWGGGSWCLKCGFSPQMNRVVCDPAELAEQEYEDDEELKISDLFKAVPIWAYILFAGCVALLVMSIAIRVSVPDIYYRGIIALYLAGFGGVIFALSHLRAFFISAQDTDKIAFASMFTAPVMIWQEAFKRLPKVQMTFYCGGWGFSTLILAVVVVGLDWNGLFKPEQYANRPKFNPMKFLVKSAMTMANLQGGGKGGAGSMLEAAGASGNGGGLAMPADAGGLESAIGEFADVSGVAGFNDVAGGGGGGGGGSAPAGVGGIESSVNQMLPNGSPVAGGAGGGSGEETTHAQALKTQEQKDALAQNNGTTSSNSESDTETPNGSKTGSANEKKTALRQFPKANKQEVVVDPDRPDRIEFVVIGYTTNAGGELRSLLLADMKGSRPRKFKTRLQLAETDKKTVANLEETLSEIRTRNPAVRTPYSAKWVRPVVMCDIAYNGLSTSGTLNDGLVADYYVIDTTSAISNTTPRR